MKKTIIAMILLLSAFSFAEQCYFQTRRTSYEAGTSVKKISCQVAKKCVQDIRFYNKDNADNYVRYYEQKIGKEGNLIVEENGEITIMKFYYALGEYRYYGGLHIGDQM